MNLKNPKPSKTANPPSTTPSDIYRLGSYFYHLPEELIAQRPCERRDQARLMIIDRHEGTIRHDSFSHLKHYLPDPSLIVINNSRVIPARLLGHRSTGGAVEIFLLSPLKDGYSFEVLLRPLKKMREGETIDFSDGVRAVVSNKEKRIVRFNKKNIIKHLQKIGHIPLPPYIKRPDTSHDREDYQTVYAKKFGSVASPTAGLHFTNDLMNELRNHGHRFLELTLHINYGTFKPVECPDIRSHQMHAEPYKLTQAGLKSILEAKKKSFPVVAVGSTSCRVLESVNHSGILEGHSNMFIYPNYKFKITDALITNFHLPYSTLLMLACAFGGYDLVMKAYQEAINKRYRFYSYGDAMLIL
ncbi:MAG: tRNA preQ1(34) S-adenosylmethionine ribosyltransferase-isomerase QueA [Candidatus Omnitrophica bacterium]|nr:tRNA preQ1(34) S-adenosylmethionine ribosyltransferase-isomerase QueA [Candidatus Omnitrophota bacterium]